MPAGAGCPNYEAAQAFFLTASQRCDVMRTGQKGSLLGQTFNRLWAAAFDHVQHGATHFCMLHSDVAPKDFWWLDSLVAEFQKCQAEFNADLLACAVPIKNQTGQTSTAVGDPDDDWDFRRIMQRELQQLPETFTAADIPESITEGRRTVLLANTGCWIVDLRNPLWKQLNDDGTMRFHFTIQDRISILSDGRRCVEVIPEDWWFSRLIHQAGGIVAVTRKIPLKHHGFAEWDSEGVWGGETDLEAVRFHGSRKLEINERGCWIDPHGNTHRHDCELAAELRRFFAAETVLDIGCGKGDYLRAFRAGGVECWGIDGNPHTPQLTAGLGDVADITQPLNGEVPAADWVLCLEVLEHVPPDYESIAVDNVCSHARRGIVVSWAQPGQGGDGHFNEQPLEYVREQFEARGFRYHEQDTQRLRSQASSFWGKNNLMVFYKEQNRHVEITRSPGEARQPAAA